MEYLTTFIIRLQAEDDTAKTYSSRSALSKGVWVKDLPTNNYEPLETSHGARASDGQKGERLIFLLKSFLNHFFE